MEASGHPLPLSTSPSTSGGLPRNSFTHAFHFSQSFYCPLFFYRFCHCRHNGVFPRRRGKHLQRARWPQNPDGSAVSGQKTGLTCRNLQMIIFRTLARLKGYLIPFVFILLRMPVCLPLFLRWRPQHYRRFFLLWSKQISRSSLGSGLLTGSHFCFSN